MLIKIHSENRPKMPLPTPPPGLYWSAVQAPNLSREEIAMSLCKAVIPLVLFLAMNAIGLTGRPPLPPGRIKEKPQCLPTGY